MSSDLTLRLNRALEHISRDPNLTRRQALQMVGFTDEECNALQSFGKKHRDSWGHLQQDSGRENPVNNMRVEFENINGDDESKNEDLDHVPYSDVSGQEVLEVRNDSSSSEGEQSPDLVESSILTVGSRVLVSYKGHLYKATIRKRREKADTHEFLIHYDGNEKTTVHWVGSNRINKILETDVDTPPQKNNSMSPHRNKRSNCEKQRKSRSDVVRNGDAIRQTIHENEKSRDDNGVLKKKKRKVDGAVSSTGERQTEETSNLTEAANDIDPDQVSPNIKTAKPLEAVPREKSDTTIFDVACALKPSRNIEYTAAEAGNDSVYEVTGEESDKSFTRSSNNPSQKHASSAKISKFKSQSEAGRKQTKIKHRNDSSSSEEEQSPDLVETSILTVGSRVLVSYKGQLYKATIRKRREKADTHDFLIHYDGNKKTTVHWIGSNRINKILETDDDTPPQKNNSMSSHRNKRSNCEKKRKSRSDVVRHGDAIRQIHENEKSRDDNGVLKKKKRKVDGAVSSTVERQTTRSAPLSKYEKQWEEQFNLLIEFKLKEGHCNVPLRNHELGRWVSNQRTEQKNNTLEHSRKKRLQDLGFVWDMDDFRWEAQFKQLEKFKKDNGHCHVPKRYRGETITSLGYWVNKQRVLYKNYKHNEPACGMSDDRINRLENIGFEWIG